MQIDQKILKGLIAEQFPQLKQHLEKVEFDLSMVGENWMSTIFINHLNKETLQFVLSCFFIKGQKVILRIALIIIEILQEEIMKMNEFEDIHKFLQDIS